MYKVIRAFHDLTDSKATKDGEIFHEYKAGDIYPRNGAETNDFRIAELSSPHNAQGKPLIEFVEGEKAEAKTPAANKPAAKKPAARKTAGK